MASRALKIDPKKTIMSDPDSLVQPGVSTSINENDIAVLAYQHWQARGCPHGSGQEDWLAAEEELKSQQRQPQKSA